MKLERGEMTIYIKPDPDCPHCRGMGEVYDTVDYGSTTAQMASYCACVEEQIQEGDEDKEIELVFSKNELYEKKLKYFRQATKDLIDRQF